MPGFLLIVSGLPAAGKSTLARRLARDFGVPHIQRDRIKQGVFTEIERVPGAQPYLAVTTDRMILAFVGAILDAGGGAVLDNNFNTERHITPVREFVETRNVQAAEVCLWGDPAELRRRFVARADPPLTPDLQPYFETVVHRPRDPVLRPPALIEQFDTTDFTELEAAYPSLLARLRAACS